VWFLFALYPRSHVLSIISFFSDTHFHMHNHNPDNKIFSCEVAFFSFTIEIVKFPWAKETKEVGTFVWRRTQMSDLSLFKLKRKFFCFFRINRTKFFRRCREWEGRTTPWTKRRCYITDNNNNNNKKKSKRLQRA
jgi:hypothetical protein